MKDYLKSSMNKMIKSMQKYGGFDTMFAEFGEVQSTSGYKFDNNISIDIKGAKFNYNYGSRRRDVAEDCAVFVRNFLDQVKPGWRERNNTGTASFFMNSPSDFKCSIDIWPEDWRSYIECESVDIELLENGELSVINRVEPQTVNPDFSGHDDASLLAAVQELKDRGYALALWTPDELKGADPDHVAEIMIERGQNEIHGLGVEDSLASPQQGT